MFQYSVDDFVDFKSVVHDEELLVALGDLHDPFYMSNRMHKSTGLSFLSG